MAKDSERIYHIERKVDEILAILKAIYGSPAPVPAPMPTYPVSVPLPRYPITPSDWPPGPHITCSSEGCCSDCYSVESVVGHKDFKAEITD